MIMLIRLVALCLIAFCVCCNLQQKEEDKEKEQALILLLIIHSQQKEKPCTERPLEEAIACIIEGIDFGH